MDFMTSIREVVFRTHQSAREISLALGKPYSTLLRECNPYDKGAKLGAETLFQIMKETGNVEPLRWMAENLGYDLIKKEI